jgi:putative tricarboxylic transport membrane protein
VNPFDKKSSLVWFFFSLLVILGSTKYSFGVLSRPGPGFLPMLCGITMASLSLMVFLRAVWQEKKGAKIKGEAFLTSRWPKIVTVLIFLLAYWFFLETLGYLVMTFIFIILVLKVVDPGSWRSALIEAVGAAVFSYLLFEVWLQVQLPKGFWPNLFS